MPTILDATAASDESAMRRCLSAERPAGVLTSNGVRRTNCRIWRSRVTRGNVADGVLGSVICVALHPIVGCGLGILPPGKYERCVVPFAGFGLCEHLMNHRLKFAEVLLHIGNVQSNRVQRVLRQTFTGGEILAD